MSIIDDLLDGVEKELPGMHVVRADKVVELLALRLEDLEGIVMKQAAEIKALKSQRKTLI